MASNHSRDQSSSKDLAQELFDAAFTNTTRDPRSDAYKQGVLAVLRYRCHGLRFLCPYPVGSAESDAFFAGCDEGHALWREHQQREGGVS